MYEETKRGEGDVSASIHESVLLQESIDALALKKGSIILDGTINGGGHSEEICKQIGKSGTLLGLDLDKEALKRAERRLLKSGSRIFLENENFRNMDKAAARHNLSGFNAILLDLGFSSDQLNPGTEGSKGTLGRGFSFKNDEPLLLTFRSDSSEEAFTARDIVNSWSEEQIADVIYGYGEERFARRIARSIVRERKEHPIETTQDLVAVIKEAVPLWYRHGRIHPATRTFQALRIAVNDEIDALRDALKSGIELLLPNGRLTVISYHSIEDRVVKRAFENALREGKGILITKKPITPTKAEIKKNPRARSAKLRVFQVNN